MLTSLRNHLPSLSHFGILAESFELAALLGPATSVLSFCVLSSSPLAGPKAVACMLFADELADILSILFLANLTKKKLNPRFSLSSILLYHSSAPYTIHRTTILFRTAICLLQACDTFFLSCFHLAKLNSIAVCQYRSAVCAYSIYQQFLKIKS